MSTAMATLSTPRDDLVESLEKHNATFTKLLSLIPARFYLPPDQDELDSRWMKNKKRRTGEEIKEHKRKAKADKLDPANNLTTDQLLAQQITGATTTTSEAEAGPSSLPPVQIAPLPPTASISDLRAKLHDRLDKFKRDRGEPETRDELEAERRAKRGEMRDKRRKERKEQRRKSKAEPTAKPAKQQLIVPQLHTPVDSVSYQSMALPSTSKQSKAPLKHISNPSQALAHLEKHNSKLAGLPEEKRKEVEERERWAKAEERARGGKVADEEKTLKKAVKRLEKTKSKSGKDWVERKKNIEQSQATSIKKRNDNIASRIQTKRDKKMGIKDKGKKSAGGGSKGGKGGGKKRPGFEGGKGKGRKEQA